MMRRAFGILMSGLVCWMATAETAVGGLVVKDQGYDDYTIERSNFVYAIVSLTDGAGNPITGRTLEDFTLTESIIIPPSGELVDGPATVDISSAYHGHFHLEAFGASKLDIVVIIDGSGTMAPDVPHIRSELHELIDRLIASHIDFRFALGEVDVTPGLDIGLPLVGAGDEERIRQQINGWTTGGEWWSPTNTYFGLLATDILGFRPDVRKICVIITDILPQTPYGTFWYEPGGNSADTLAGVHEYLRRHPDLEVYFAFDSDRDHPDFGSYVDNGINPMAGDAKSGFAALEAHERVTALRPAPGQKPWPFQQELIPIPAVSPLDAQYCLVWDNSLAFDSGQFDRDQGYYKVVIETDDPDNASQKISADVLLRVDQPSPTVLVHVTDEEGTIRDGDYWGYLLRLIGSHRIQTHYQTSCRDGGRMTFTNVEPGRYLMAIFDGGIHGTAFNNLAASFYQVITVPSEGLELNAAIRSDLHDGDMSRALGLARELRNWAVPGAPFYQTCNEAEQWLLGLEANGLSWVEQEQVRRFYWALSGFANVGEYARMEIDQSAVIFKHIVEDVAKLVEQVQNLEETTSEGWRQALDILLDIVYAILSKGEITAKKQIVEQGLSELLKYASRQLVPEVKDAIIEELGFEEWTSLLKAIIQHLIDRNYEDWSDVIDAARQVAMHHAVNEISDRLADGFSEAICAGIGAGDSYKEIMAPLVKRLIKALAEADTAAGDAGFDNIGDELERFAQDLVQQLGAQYIEEHRLEAANKIHELFLEAMGNVPDELSGIVIQFLLQMGNDMAVEAASTVNVQTGKCSLNKDRITDLLVRNAFYFVVLKHFYVDEARTGLELALARARAWTPASTARWESDGTGLERCLGDAAGDTIHIIRYLQDDAWDAMETQEDAGNWIAALRILGRVLEPLGYALDYFAVLYPTLEDVANGVKGFAIAVNGLQITTQAVELALRMDCLDRFGNAAKDIYPAAFPGFAATIGAATVETAIAEATEGAAGSQLVFTIELAAMTPAPTVINYTMSGTAQNGIDYYPLPGSLLILPGQQNAQVFVRPIADRLAEDDETVVLTLEEGGYDVAYPFCAEGAIHDQGLPGVSVRAEEPIGRESTSVSGMPLAGSAAVFRFERTGSLDGQLGVNYSIWGSATNGEDYETIAESIAIPAGQASADLAITPRPDGNDWEGNESVSIYLETGDYALTDSREATAYICDGDARAVWVEATDPMAVEGASPDSAVFTVTRRGTTTGTLTVYFDLQGTADNFYDYNRVDEEVTIPAGEASATVTITPKSDSDQESVESVILVLEPLDARPNDPAEDYLVAEPALATALIYDADATVVTVHATDGVAMEGSGDAGRFVVARRGGTGRDLVIPLTISGSAAAGQDYVAIPGSVTLAAGHASAEISVSPLDDPNVEGMESVRLTIAPGSGYQTGDPSAAVVAIEDDEAPTTDLYVDNIMGIPGQCDGSSSAPYTTIGKATEHAALIATAAAVPIAIHVGHEAASSDSLQLAQAQVFDESVNLPPNVTLRGSGSDKVTIQGLDPSRPVVTAGEGSALSGFRLTIADPASPGRWVLLTVEDAAVAVRACVLDGRGHGQSIGMLVRGPLASGTLVENCSFRNLHIGVLCENAAPMFRLNLFEDLDYGFYVMRSPSGNPAVPRLGGIADGLALGLNRFMNINILYMKNFSPQPVVAQHNAWDGASADKVQSACLGPIDVNYMLGDDVSEGLYVFFVNARSGKVIGPSATATLQIDGGALPVQYDGASGVFHASGVPAGLHSFMASVDGFDLVECELAVEAQPTEIILLNMIPKNASKVWHYYR